MWETGSHKLPGSSDFPPQSKPGSCEWGLCGTLSKAVACALQYDKFSMSNLSRWLAEELGWLYVQVIKKLVANELFNAMYRLQLILFMVLIAAIFNSQN